MFDTIFVYVPEMKQLVRISEGTGDNLLDEDIDSGYMDYIYYEQYELGPDIRETDGGQVMLTKLFREQFTCTKDAVPHVLDMAFGDEGMKYIVLD